MENEYCRHLEHSSLKPGMFAYLGEEEEKALMGRSGGSDPAASDQDETGKTGISQIQGSPDPG